MARRTVTATFAGGMISDEPAPGTARYLENMVPRPDGVLPMNPVKRWYRYATAITTSHGITTAAVVQGWSGGGTVHPKHGFVGLVDTVVTATAIPSTTADLFSHIGDFGLEGTGKTRALVCIDDIEDAVGMGNFTFADQGGLYPIASTSVLGTSAAMSAATEARPLYGLQRWVNTEDEVLIVGQNAGGVSEVIRYGGSTATTYKGVDPGVGVTSANSSGIGMISPTAHNTWTDTVNIAGITSTASIVPGTYIGIAVGESIERGTTPAGLQMREFRVEKVLSTASPMVVKLDRKIYFSTYDRYLKCVVSNTAVLQASQISRTEATQSFSEPATVGSNNGFYYWNSAWDDPVSAPIPNGACGSTYHQGRLWLASGSKLRWSGTQDETLQLTATGYFSTASSITATATGTATYGIEYKHISLWSANGYVNVFPDLCGDIVGLVSMKDELLVMKRGGLFRVVGGVSYDGETNSFDLQSISNSIGPEGIHSWAETPAGVIFTWNDAIWLYDGNEIQEISAGAVSNSFSENVRSHRQSNTGLGAESVATRVCTDGSNVFFTPMRYTISTATSQLEAAFTNDMHKGSSIHNKHLVLSLRDRKWFYISSSALNLPAAILPIRSKRGSKYASYWLNAWKRYSSDSGNQLNYVDIIDIHGMLHEAGPNHSLHLGTTAWSAQEFDPAYAVAVSHPLTGMGSFDTLRPRAALIKRTDTGSGSQTTSTSTGTDTGKIRVIDTEASFVPVSSGFMSSAALAPSIPGVPHWWEDMSDASTGTLIAASDDDQDANARSRWEVEGSTSTARAMSLLDRVTLDNHESAMSAPTIFYYDNFWWRDKESNVMRYQYSLLHGVGIEFEEVNNRSDR